MVSRVLTALAVATALLALHPAMGRGQTPQPSPVVPVASGDRAGRMQAEVFARKVSLRLEHVTLKDALDAIAERGHVPIAYSRDDVPLAMVVSLVVDSITIGDALTVLLRGTGISVTLSPNGRLLLERVSGVAPVTAARELSGPAPGSIKGLVTDSITKATVPRVELRVLETGQSVVSNPQGEYTIQSLAPGEYHVTARRVGFIARTHVVIVAEGATVTLNFALNQPPTKLDEIVTTALGEQRRYTVGNDIATINADSITPTAPITSMTDLMTGRAPGVQIIESGGLTGEGEAIRIRGQSSLVLQGDPIIIVDGIRVDNTAGSSATHLFSSNVTGSPNRLNDIDFSQVATIDVLKGPSAATEYGTDAANGVIVITTKRGISGKPQWNISAEEGFSDIPVSFPNYYYSWGHLTDGSGSAVQCPLTGTPSSTAGSCAVDSVTHFNPLNHPQYSIYGTGSREKYDLSVSGGQDAVRYYVAGALSNETGVARLPDVFRSEAEALGMPAAAINPNGEQQRSVRANTYAKLGSTADLTFTGAYLSTFQTIPGSRYFAAGPTNGLSYPDSAHGYGYGNSVCCAEQVGPIEEFGQIQTQQTDRFIGGLTSSWRPWPWLASYGTVGLDHGTQVSQSTLYPQSQYPLTHTLNRGAYELEDVGTDLYSADFRASATAPITSTIRAVTSVGIQMRDTRTAGQTGTAQHLTPTNLTLNGAASPSIAQIGSRSATLGGYGEEQFSFSDRLFLTGALRIDAGSGFGYAYHTAAYPKVSGSWLAVQDGQTSVRLRTAFGESGVQPNNGASLQLYVPTTAYLNGTTVSSLSYSSPGNPNLQPERSQEWEGGTDISFFANRVSLGLTGYLKTTQNALYDQSLGFDVGYGTIEENIGEVTNSGFEATLTATLVQAHNVSWGVTLNGAYNTNKLVHLAPGITGQQIASSDQRNAVGYPLYGYWGLQEHYADLNHDGVLEPNEVTLNDSVSYLGSSIPKQTGSLATHITLWRVFTINAVFNYAGGFLVENVTALRAAQSGTLEEQNIAGAPLWLQARAVAAELPQAGDLAEPSGFFENGTYVRFSELSATYELPVRWAHRIRARTLSLTGAVRNLALWTKYSGPDPEASTPGANTNPAPLGSNPYATTIVNNDLRADASAVPLARYWMLRLNIGL
jgi:TonB-linked SusC/RagA family outer membrane protein